jgi:endonuclease/exonuclease/phosphatase family metal-dependent hydrolase
MRIASFNVENLFSRVRAMNLESWADGREVLANYSILTTILQRTVYEDADRQAILVALEALDLLQDDESRFVRLRQNRGHLLRRPLSGPPVVVAGGRGDWIGWLELKAEAVNEIAITMTARVIQDVDADVLAVIEAEDRIALARFNDQLLRPLAADYDRIMLIDGNDERGIDVGLMVKRGWKIETVVSHVDDMDGGARVFSRDCPEYSVRFPGHCPILLLVNHFKSKGYGSQASSDRRRKAQAQRVREIYELRRLQGFDRIAVLGDFNDTPASDPLSPLLGNDSDLQDVFGHTAFVSDGRPGTFGTGNKSNKIDYLLLSPALFERVTAAGVWRKGVWGGVHGTLFPHYDEMTRPVHAASDHAAVWADISL